MDPIAVIASVYRATYTNDIYGTKGATMKSMNTKKTLKAAATAAGLVAVLLLPTGCTATAATTGGTTGGTLGGTVGGTVGGIVGGVGGALGGLGL